MTAADTFTIEFDPPLDAVAVAVSRWADMIDSFDEVLERIGDLFRAQMRVHFESEGRATGQPWAPLTDAWAARKAREFPGRPMLVQSGALRASLVSGGPGFIEEVGPGRARFSTSVEYAPALLAGGRNPVGGGGEQRGSFGWAVAELFAAYLRWSRARAFRGVTEDPFDDASFSSAIAATMRAATGADGEMDRAAKRAARSIRGR